MFKLKIIISLITLILMVSCENAKVNLADDVIVTGRPNLDPNKPPGDDPSKPPKPPNPPKPPIFKTIKVKARSVRVEEIRDLELPYKQIFFKPIKFGKRVKGKIAKKCHKKYKKKCVVNKQVLFKFNMDKFNEKEDFKNYRIQDMFLIGSFYSIGKNHKNELLCILNNGLYRCSGKAVDSFPGIGLRFLAKMLYWNVDFWLKGYNEVVKSPFFSEQYLYSGYDEKTNTYVRKNIPISFNRCFQFANGELETLASSDDIYMVVTDDTYVDEDLDLEIRLKRID